MMNFLKNFYKETKFSNIILYIFSIVIVIFLVAAFFKVTHLYDFFNMMENKTFDLRQKILVNSKIHKATKDIVIVAIDDASYEFLIDKYGSWPIPRHVYADLINYLELQQPTSITFDLMFVKSLKNDLNSDLALIKAMNSYDNVLTAINLDNQPSDVREPITLPERLAVEVQNDDKDINLSEYLTYSNVRSILPELIDGKVDVGLVNVIRSEDGVLRKMPPFAIYKNSYYPHLSVLTGEKYLQKIENKQVTDYVINKSGNLKLADRTLPIDNDGGVILNWYGQPGQTYKYVPIYKLIKDMESGQKLSDTDFKNKIIFFGTTATSMHDTKSVPISNMGETYPGVEIYATFVNNFIDNNFIKKVPEIVNILITVLLAAFVAFVVIRTKSTVIALSSTILGAFLYIGIAYYSMKFFNLWFAIVLPLIILIVVFIHCFIVKYLLKSRDFDYQYKLATTDGLTELYNHRYFQDQLKMQIDSCKRYETHFSLIIIDIDFFKKFNDTYGHQAGDAVLRQVAQTLKRNVRATDIVCRYGGEEMSIILTNTDKEEAIFNANRICKAVSERTFKLNATQESNVTISLGVSTFPQDGETNQQLIEVADNGLYYAKEHGRNQVGLAGSEA